jgi:hypothetical protein
MSAARELAVDQPPVFVRTTWLFREIDDAMGRAVLAATNLQVARLNHDKPMTIQLYSELAMHVGQIHTLCVWANEQFEKPEEDKNADQAKSD